MDERDPQRWSSPDADVPDDVRQILASAAADQPDAARLSRFVGRVKGALPAQPTAAPATARFAAAKSVAAVALVAGGALLAYLALSPRQPRRPTRSHSVPTAPAAPAPTAPAPPAPTPPRASAAAPTAASAASPPGVSVSPGPGTPTAHPRAPSAPAAEREPVDTLEQEVRLLRSARDLLARDPAAALRLADQHRSRFPRGALAQEREVLSIEALAKQGRTADARERAERFRTAYPGSAHLDRLPVGADPGHN